MNVTEIMSGVWKCSSPPMEKEEWQERQKRMRRELEEWKSEQHASTHLRECQMDLERGRN